MTVANGDRRRGSYGTIPVSDGYGHEVRTSVPAGEFEAETAVLLTGDGALLSREGNGTIAPPGLTKPVDHAVLTAASTTISAGGWHGR
jgi:hypothetical protein